LASVTDFLLKSNILSSYDHLNSDICLDSEEDAKETYTAEYDATHYYCTNDCHEADYAFSIQINKNSGAITVIKG
jgi:hypothetical protein